MEKVEIVNDNFGLRKWTLLDELTCPFAMRLTEERLTEKQKSLLRQRLVIVINEATVFGWDILLRNLR